MYIYTYLYIYECTQRDTEIRGMVCIFCEIVAGRAPCHKVYEVRRSIEILIYEGTARRLRVCAVN